MGECSVLMAAAATDCSGAVDCLCAPVGSQVVTNTKSVHSLASSKASSTCLAAQATMYSW